ncbi:MAG: glycosyltransferase family 8 protein [Candidatus Nanoarchaeia archaeon]|nr:glycosyltransferase family 8 protein [Candidatus Nanoarchaeia archaeon]
MANEYHVCYCVDKDYEKYAVVSIISLLLNSKINPEIHIIHSDLADKKKLKIAEKLFKKKFKYYLAEDSEFYGLPILGGYSVYYRLLAPRIFPKKIKKILYLDCDTIIEGDLSGLFSVDLHGKALAAAEDINMIKLDLKNFKKRLGIPKNGSYFNSGVMLLNLDFFRKKNLSKKIIDFMKKNVEKIVMHDQDGLNAVLHNDWIILPEEYNFICSPFWDFSKAKNSAPKIVHFAGIKPELLKIISPQNIYCKKYYKYFSMTPFQKEKVSNKEIIRMIKRLYDVLFKSKFFY